MFVNPKNIQKVTLDGESLTVEMAVAVARFHAKVEIAEYVKPRIVRSRKTVEAILSRNEAAYGISTGFGDFSKVHIGRGNADKLQNNLIISHCAATGDPYSEEVARAMLLLRANALCKGFSGIRLSVIETLVAMLNKGVHPVVPQKGSLGASGDLAPLAHMSLVLLGKGEAFYRSERMEGAKAMALAGIPTVYLRAKEGLALINGTQAMCATGVLSFYDSLCAARLADIAGSMTLEALTGLVSAFDDRVQAVRPHAGQREVAKNFRLLSQGSEILEASRNARVQDAYTLRCIPQVHGAVRDTLAFVRDKLETEINSVTDNPIIFSEEEEVVSGGNFHGEPMALCFDYLGIAVSELASISERRLERMVNPALSNGLPAFLTRDGGLNSGLMICQYSAASMVSENKVFAHPASVDSIPSSANQEDHVSMGTTASRKSRWIVENTLSVLAFEFLAAAQSVYLRGGKMSPVHQKLYDVIRRESAPLEDDRELRIDVEKMNALVRGGALIEITAAMLPDFQ